MANNKYKMFFKRAIENENGSDQLPKHTQKRYDISVILKSILPFYCMLCCSRGITRDLNNCTFFLQILLLQQLVAMFWLYVWLKYVEQIIILVFFFFLYKDTICVSFFYFLRLKNKHKT